MVGDTQLVTICDREADIYEFFQLSAALAAPVLVRANSDRPINKRSRYAEKASVKLWPHLEHQPCAGSCALAIPARQGTNHATPRTPRLIRYVTVMSILAWRVLLLTLMARTHPEAPCTTLLTDTEWKVLYCTVNHTTALPAKTPSLREVVIWLARLGGFLARRQAGQPGTMTLWRGWKRLTDLTPGWLLATEGETCG